MSAELTQHVNNFKTYLKKDKEGQRNSRNLGKSVYGIRTEDLRNFVKITTLGKVTLYYDYTYETIY